MERRKSTTGETKQVIKHKVRRVSDETPVVTAVERAEGEPEANKPESQALRRREWAKECASPIRNESG